MTRGGQSDKIPDYIPEAIYSYLVDEYWQIKCGDIDYRIMPRDLRDTLLDRNERGIILKMDRAFLASIGEYRAEAARKKAEK